MTKRNRTDQPKKFKSGSHKKNAVGYAKRQSLKAKTHSNPSDVYEYTPDPKIRRSKITLDVGRDEAAELGLGRAEDGDDADGSDEVNMRLKARLVEEGETIDSGDDENIDSDAAFEESDEERFAGFGFSYNKGKKAPARSSKKRSVQFEEVDLDEDDDANGGSASSRDGDDTEEEEEEQGESDEFIDVLDIFDGKGEADDGDDDKMDSQPSKEHSDSGSEDEEGGESEEAEEESDGDEQDSDIMDLYNSDAEDPSPEALTSLENFISTLDPSRKRKASADEETTDAPAPRKRRIIKERTEAGLENEFAAQSSGSTKLNLEDLLAPLASQSSNLIGLKKSAKVLASTSGPKTLSAPLPQRTQERVDREAAYEQTREEVDKWSETMKRIKEAEHLSFPLQAQAAGKVSNLELTAKFKPTTELESSIDKLLKSAKMREEDIQQTEQLAMNHLSVEEVATRRAELRKMRELMFRAEVKAKRVSKIKSKTYRRIKKKEREKLAAKLDVDDADDEEERLKREVERARERATLKHKNTGKWAKAMRAKGELDVDERREISEMLERGERLRKKIRGDKGSDEDEDEENDEDSEDDDGGDGLSKIKASAFEELAKIDKEIGIPEDGRGKSIFEMKFMKNAAAQKQQQTDRMVDDFIQELGGKDDGSDADDVEKFDGSAGPTIERTGGRAVYRPAIITSQITARPLASLASDTSSVTLQSADLPQDSPPPEPQLTPRPVPVPLSTDSNPWLAARETTSKAPRKKNEVIVGKGSASIDKSKNKIRKQTKKQDEEKDKAKDDAVLEISTDDVMILDRPPGLITAPSKNVKGESTAHSSKGTTNAAAEDSDTNSEIEEQEKALKRKTKAKGVKAFEQRDLVARAFAGDNVVQAFEDAKRQEMAEDAPRSVDTTLPGWGSWGGSGTRRQPPKPHLIKKVAGIDPSTRSDFNKKHIIISEKRDKKAAKYMVKDLPYPYTSKAQFERSIDTPLGTEWNTRVGFQRATLPKVVKKMGTVIDPLEKLF